VIIRSEKERSLLEAESDEIRRKEKELSAA